MINCYKILEVPNFADDKTIQRGYRTLAKKYHPDAQVGKGSEELFVVVSKAYQTLSNLNARTLHDEQLKQALLWESEPAFRKKIEVYREQGMSDERRRAWAFAQAKKEIADFEKKNAIFPFTLRIVTGFVVALFALYVIYANFFIDLNSNELPLMILGYGMFVLGCVVVLAHVYKKLRIDLLLKRAKWSYDKFSFTLFFAMLVIGPGLVFGLNSYRRIYHMEHYPALTTAKIIEMSGNDEVLFSYKPIDSDHVFMKRKSLNENNIFNLSDEWVIVRYSIADPRIVELVEKIE